MDNPARLPPYGMFWASLVGSYPTRWFVEIAHALTDLWLPSTGAFWS